MRVSISYSFTKSIFVKLSDFTDFMDLYLVYEAFVLFCFFSLNCLFMSFGPFSFGSFYFSS